jgi:hypothetical protein
MPKTEVGKWSLPMSRPYLSTACNGIRGGVDASRCLP